MNKDKSIIELNMSAEPFVLQAGKDRSKHYFGKLYGDRFVPLTFVHASDMHADTETWKRMTEYINYYSDYIEFGLHTGDYCGGTQAIYDDMYKAASCVKPIYNCTGNHDCVTPEDVWTEPAPKADTHKLLFNHTEDWDVTYMDCDYPMSYYKDFDKSNVRLIVLDLYYDIFPTRMWLRGILKDALEKGLHVVTAMHEPTNYIEETFDVAFRTLDKYREAQKEYELKREELSFDHRGRVTYEDVIAEFIQNGGNYVCNLAGHDHHDNFGLTQRGVLNVVIENGTSWDMLGDSRRIKGTRSYDCFNVVAIDTELGILKLIRIGNNVDHYMREKKVLCFDYVNKRVISNI